MAGETLVPYVVRKGDHLLKIALKRGFDAAAIWGDPKNATLRKARTSMHVLCVGDVLYIPKSPDRDWMAINVGAKNPFVANVPVVQIAVKFVLQGKALASERCTISELPKLGELTTTSDGTLKFEAPVALEIATVEFVDVQLVQPLRIGHLDPVSEPTGVYQRLNNLGYVFDDPDEATSVDAGSLRDPLSAFQSAQGMTGATGELDDDTRTKLKSDYGC
jgi:hypothetical protein